MLNRRSFMAGGLALCAAPAIGMAADTPKMAVDEFTGIYGIEKLLLADNDRRPSDSRTWRSWRYYLGLPVSYAVINMTTGMGCIDHSMQLPIGEYYTLMRRINGDLRERDGVHKFLAVLASRDHIEIPRSCVVGPIKFYEPADVDMFDCTGRIQFMFKFPRRGDV